MTTTDPHPVGFSTLTLAARRAELLDPAQESELARRAGAGDAPALDRLLAAHLRLVLAIAYEMRTHGLPVDDLVGEGLLGLVEAARRFEPERGVRLAAYAAFWIRAYMRRYTINNRRIVRTPSSRHGRKLLANLRKTQRALAQRHGVAPDAETVAAALGVGVRDVEEMECALSGRDIPCERDAEGRGYDVPSTLPTPEVMVADAEARQRSKDALHGAIGALSARERHILQRHYLDERGQSLAEIGRGMGLSRERVRQIEHEAHRKVRHAMSAAV